MPLVLVESCFDHAHMFFFFRMKRSRSAIKSAVIKKSRSPCVEFFDKGFCPR